MTDTAWEHAGDRVRARRTATRTLHPDVGGDAEAFTAALAEIDRRFGTRTGPVGDTHILILRTPRGRTQARLRAIKAALRQARLRLPHHRTTVPS